MFLLNKFAKKLHVGNTLLELNIRHTHYYLLEGERDTITIEDIACLKKNYARVAWNHAYLHLTTYQTRG